MGPPRWPSAGLGLPIVADEPKYFLKRRHPDQPKPTWDEFDEETRRKITATLASTVGELLQSWRPALESVRAAVLASIHRWIVRREPVNV